MDKTAINKVLTVLRTLCEGREVELNGLRLSLGVVVLDPTDRPRANSLAVGVGMHQIDSPGGVPISVALEYSLMLADFIKQASELPDDYCFKLAAEIVLNDR
jgi:hypothetical protein